MTNLELLLNAVESLNVKLKERGIFIGITVVGSISIHLNGLKVDHETKDIDYIDYEPSEEFLKCVEEVAIDMGLSSDWINNRADSIEPLPKEINDEVIEDLRFSNIKMKVIKPSLIAKLKIYAYYMRREDKDLIDLKSIAPSKEWIDAGIDFIKETIEYHHGKSYRQKQDEEVEGLREVLYDNFL